MTRHSRDEILSAIIAQLSSVIDDKSVALDSDTELISLNLLDSMDLLTIVSWAESKYEVSVDPECLIPENFETPAKIADFISATLAA